MNSREIVQHALAHLDHVLPAQAPIQDFVHHNTLHGLQHLAFDEALEEYRKLTGVVAYLPESRFREYFSQGRITAADVDYAISKTALLNEQETLFVLVSGRLIKRGELYRLSLYYGFEGLTQAALEWKLNEQHALKQAQADLPDEIKQALFSDGNEAQTLCQMWQALTAKMGLAEKTDCNEAALAFNTLEGLFQDVLGRNLTFRAIALALTGVDVLQSIQPLLIKYCASALDYGVAAWRLSGEQGLSLFRAWRDSMLSDLELPCKQITHAQHLFALLPDDSVEVIVWHLNALDLAQADWSDYLQSLALELPGWAGMVNWRQQHLDFLDAAELSISLADFLAMRLTLDRLFLEPLFREHWQCIVSLSALKSYFRKNPTELALRRLHFQGKLPESLSYQVERQLSRVSSEWDLTNDWQSLALQYELWRYDTQESVSDLSRSDCVWPLFRLVQHLGLNVQDCINLKREDLLLCLELLRSFSSIERSKVWLLAFEHHYQQVFLAALAANFGQGRWMQRQIRPEAQAVFCIDEREESLRRHLEELNPMIETLGGAGFFGLPIHYRGLDDVKRTVLCPAGVIPPYQVNEDARPEAEQVLARHVSGLRWYKRLNSFWQYRLRQNTLWAHLLTDFIAPWRALELLARSFVPTAFYRLERALHHYLLPEVPTMLHFDSPAPGDARHEEMLQGLSEADQVQRLAAFLKTSGLTQGFAPIVCFVAHGSTSQNNPHEAAHDCGACSGRRGGPNARLFAAIANRSAIRSQLAELGIVIPDDVWFIGAEHDTSNDAMSWFDIEDLPAELVAKFAKFKQEMLQAAEASAQERCRRFNFAMQPETFSKAFRHVTLRAQDLSQVRPEYGHATNATAVVGRRSVTQGLFLDRRSFLISYDPTQDGDGKLLENLLLTVGPVGAGINLEYYFSTVDNKHFGCSTKIPHNITGLFGVMEGGGSDLRTGLPWQMVEIHEAMRLLIVVESKVAILEAIYARQPALQELIGGRWVLLSVIDCDDGQIYQFDPQQGFALWQAPPDRTIQTHASSFDCYKSRTTPIAPAFIKPAVHYSQYAHG